MDVAERVVFLRAELDRQQRRFSGMRRRDKRKAYVGKMATVALSATITALLGLRVGSGAELVLVNVALVLGALVTVLAAYEAFYNHRGLWINRTVTVCRLYELRRQMDYELAGLADGDVQPEVVDKLLVQLNRTLADDHQAWMQLRSAEVHPSIPNESGEAVHQQGPT